MAREATVKIAYVPYKTFLTALDTLRQGVPDPVDKSVFQNQSFSTQNMLLSSLKALGTIDDDGHPLPILKRLVDPATRKDALREVIEDKYRAVLDLGLAATEKQFDDKFREAGVGGETLNKAKSFFLQAAGVVGIALSPHIRGARTVNGDGEGGGTPRPPSGPRRRRSAKKPKDEGTGGGEVAPPPRGSSKTIQLVSGGGEVTLIVSIDPMELEDEDRDFVFGLISKLKNYEKNGGPKAAPGASRDSVAP